MKNMKLLMLAGLIAAGLPVLASASMHANEGYLVDSEGSIVRNGFGGCWHTSDWTPALAVAGCDQVVAFQEVMHQPIHVVEIKTAPPQKIATSKKIIEQTKLVLKNVNFADEDLFKFNKAVLNPKGKAVLDKLVQDLKGVRYDVIRVTGFTDRIGGTKYNKKLSLHRARTVKDYLVKWGLHADRIEVEGMGKTHPITRYADCRGMPRVKTIACLQPDRRTEITVAGTEPVPINQKISSLH